MTCRASTMRSIRTRGVSKASPTCSYSDCIHPAPRPSSNRPSEITSRVAEIVGKDETADVEGTRRLCNQRQCERGIKLVVEVIRNQKRGVTEMLRQASSSHQCIQ